MSYPIDFHKQRAEYLLDCLKSGKPIAPSQPESWTVHDMMALAGACYFGALSHGPALDGVQGIDVSKLSAEHREAQEEKFELDLAAAVQFYATLTQKVFDGEYDDELEPHVVALVSDPLSVAPVRGFKSK